MVSGWCQIVLERYRRGVRWCQEGIRKVSVDNMNLSDVVRKVSDGLMNLSDGVMNVSDGVRKVLGGIRKV